MTPLLLLLVLAASPADETAAATRALNAGDRPAAATLFRAALAHQPPHPVSLAAKHGLALCLVAADAPDWNTALDLLHAPAGDGNYPDRGDALELLAIGYRARAEGEGEGRRWDAARFFGEAAQWFADKKRPADAARCRCAHAEMDLLLNRPHEARAKTEGFVKDRDLARTPSGGRGLHVYALACLRLNEAANAERAAGRVPAGDPAFADAQVVLAEVRRRAGDAGEAVALLQGVGDRPDARFPLAVLAFEAGRFAEALAIFEKLPGDDAMLWAGATLVRLGRFADAVVKLEPLKPTIVYLPDQVARWLGEARLGLALAASGSERERLLKPALDSLRAAVELVQKVPEDKDPAVKERRHNTRFALADGLLRAGQANEAADLFRRVWDEGGRPKRRDELLARRAVAYQLAGKPDPADTQAADYRRQFPAGPHLSAMARLQAEVAVARALAVGTAPNRRGEWQDKLTKAVDLCQAAEARDDPAVRVSLATLLRRAERFADAAAAVSDVPAAAGLRGDCLLRAGDAAGAAKALAGVELPAARLALGHALLRAGRFAATRDTLAGVNDPRAAADRAFAAWKAGDATAADELEAMTGPVAAVHRATVRPDAAAQLLADARQALPGDAPAEMQHLLAYRHGLALLAAGQPADARAVFEPLAQQARGQVAGAAASRRAGECRLDIAEAGLKAKPSDDARNKVREAAEELVRRAEELRDQPAGEAIRPHLYLLAARTLRTLAVFEVDRAWEQERKQKRHRWADTGGSDPPPEVERADVPVQWGERRATDVYRRLAEELPASRHAVVARLEAAALATARGHHKSAIILLTDGDDPRLALAHADELATVEDFTAALAAVEKLADPAAIDRRASCLLTLGRPAEAVEACGPAPSLRLGEALAAAGRLDQAAAVFAKLDGPSARYGAGWVAVKRHRLDEAVIHLRAAGDGRAKLLLGLVLATQGRRDEAATTLLAIRAGGGVAAEVEWAARLEAARLLGAGDMLRRLDHDLPDGDWADAVAERVRPR